MSELSKYNHIHEYVLFIEAHPNGWGNSEWLTYLKTIGVNATSDDAALYGVELEKARKNPEHFQTVRQSVKNTAIREQYRLFNIAILAMAFLMALITPISRLHSGLSAFHYWYPSVIILWVMATILSGWRTPFFGEYYLIPMYAVVVLIQSASTDKDMVGIENIIAFNWVHLLPALIATTVAIKYHNYALDPNQIWYGKIRDLYKYNEFDNATPFSKVVSVLYTMLLWLMAAGYVMAILYIIDGLTGLRSR